MPLGCRPLGFCVSAGVLLLLLGRQRATAPASKGGPRKVAFARMRIQSSVSPHSFAPAFPRTTAPPAQSLNLRAKSSSEMEEWISAIMSPLAELARPTEPYRPPQ